LSDVQQDALDSIGFDWSPIESAWNAQYSKLVTNMSQNGHCNVPKEYPQDPSFGKWVSHQRMDRETMDEQKCMSLDKIGFDWDPFKTAWDDNFQRLEAYKDRHGHCNVPKIYPQDQSLAYWVLDQRSLHAQGSLGLDRLASLKKIGFRWKFRDVNPQSLKNEALWQTTYYGKLRPFLFKHGNCSVPQRYTEDLTLGKWVSQQRNLFQKGIMRKDRMALLDGVGFYWSREN
jgi:hypothetical protein